MSISAKVCGSGTKLTTKLTAAFCEPK
jgi:hypothetical protein